MSKGNTHETYDFGNDPEFQENFYKNIDRVLNDADIDVNIEPHVSTQEGDLEFGTDSGVKTQDEAKTADVESEDKRVDNEAEAKIADAESEDKGADIEAEAKIADAETEDITADVKAEDNNDSLASDETAAAIEQLGDVEAIDETLFEINASLAMQISDELESLNKDKKNKKMSRTMKIQLGVVITIVSLLGFAFFLGFTKPGNKLLFKMGLNLGGMIWEARTDDFVDEPDLVEDEDYLEEDDLNSDAEEIDPNEIVWPEHPGDGRRVEGVYNILLLGEEAIESGSARGRTDLIIIATLNKNQNSIKLTSLMRDTLVQIPGYKDNRLNSAYEKGDLDLLYETIALNFDIRLDGCVLVNFENFEKIIDYIGGLELTLTSSEARYLNNTNYISNPQYRNVVSGTQLMNGNQVLGYARIRKRAAITGNNNDYGRTDRHRLILNAIFEKYKSKSEIELATMMFKILPMVKTDIESKTFEKLLSTFIEMRTTKIDQLRIPADGTFTDNVKVRGLDVLIPDLDNNKKILHDFVFEN